MRRVRQSDGINATRLTFPLQVVIIIVSSALSATLAVYASQSSLRSDVRNIITQMDATAKLQAATAAAEAKLQEERSASLSRDITSIKAKQELQQYEIQALKEAILKGAR